MTGRIRDLDRKYESGSKNVKEKKKEKQNQKKLKLTTMLQQNFANYIFSNCDDIHKKFEIFKILDIHKLEVGCFVYKFFHNMLPQCFAESFKLNSVAHQRQTRKCNNIHLPSLMKKVICRQSILHNGAKT